MGGSSQNAIYSPLDLIYLDSIYYSLEVDFYTDVLLKLKHPEAKSVDLSTIVSSVLPAL